jgi:hypothetical protein
LKVSTWNSFRFQQNSNISLRQLNRRPLAGAHIIMNTKITIILFFSFVTLLIGCDTFYRIPLSDSSDTLSVKYDCCQLDVYLEVWQGHAFDFYQTFDAYSGIILYPDSLVIEYKSQRCPCIFVAEKGNPKSLSISGKRKVRTAFYIKSKVNKGDTIKVFPNGYLYCGQNKLEIKPLILILSKDLRGPMGS